MATRNSSINPLTSLVYNTTGEDIYAVIKAVSEHLESIDAVANSDLEALTAAWNEAKDFSGITITTGETASWDGVNKVLTVPTVKGDKGDTGANGLDGADGVDGLNGRDGANGKDITINSITYQGNGVFRWEFSDGTNYTTPDLRGSKGDTGDQGIGVHHLKATGTTEPHGDFHVAGETDTYTFYGDPDETINLGWFSVTNGIPGIHDFTTYYQDKVMRVGDSTLALTTAAQTLLEAVNELDTDKLETAGGTISGDLVVSGDLFVNGTTTEVNTVDLLVKDNLIVVNDGEPGSGVTAGTAGIEVDRGLLANYQFLFDEVSDSFRIGEVGNLQAVATREDTPLDTGIAVWDNGTSKFVTTRDVDVDSIAVTGLVDGRDVSVDGAKLDTIETNAKDDQIASEVPYNNTTSGLVATDLQNAVDEVEGRLDTAETKLSGIEDGATADQTPAEILTAIKTVDGSGSGLDADLLDGQDSTFYTNADNLVVDPVGNLTSTNVQAGLQELQTDIDTRATKLQTSTTTTNYTDATTAVSYKLYIDNGEIIMEEL